MSSTSDVLRYGTEDGEAGIFIPFKEPYDLAYRDGWEHGFVLRKARERGVDAETLEGLTVRPRWAQPQRKVEPVQTPGIGLLMPQSGDEGGILW